MTTPAILSSETFGRFRLDVMRTRFGAVEAFVVDLEDVDEAGLPRVNVQTSDVEAARQWARGTAAHYAADAALFGTVR